MVAPMGHGRVVLGVVGVVLVFPAAAWADATLVVKGTNATYTDSTMPAGGIDSIKSSRAEPRAPKSPVISSRH